MGAPGVGALSACLQFFQRVLANCFQHAETRFTLARLYLLHQTFIHHRGHALKQIQVEITLGIAHSFYAFQIASPCEHRQSSEKPLLVGTQKIVAPVHGGTESLLALRQIARSAGQ